MDYVLTFASHTLVLSENVLTSSFAWNTKKCPSFILLQRKATGIISSSSQLGNITLWNLQFKSKFKIKFSAFKIWTTKKLLLKKENIFLLLVSHWRIEWAGTKLDGRLSIKRCVVVPGILVEVQLSLFQHTVYIQPGLTVEPQRHIK